MISKHEIKLEALGETHCEQTFQWVSQPFLQELFMISSPPTWETHKKYFPTLYASGRHSYAVLLAGEHIGNCGFKDVKEGAAELWIYIGKKELYGQGLGTAATRMLISCGFEQLGLKLIYLHVSRNNPRAVALYEKLGFIISETKGNVWENRPDMVRMELAKDNL